MKGTRCLIVWLCILMRLSATDGLTCLSCKDVTRPEDCAYTEVCGIHEKCFIDSYQTQSGTVKYDLGCEDINYCGQNRRKRANDTQTIVCSECCETGDLCNSAGCGNLGFPHPSLRGPICYNCPHHLHPGHCNHIQLCDKGSVCKISNDTHNLFSTSCDNKQACEQAHTSFASIVGRKRWSDEMLDDEKHCIHKCCDADLCNGYCGTSGVDASPQTQSPQHTDPCLSNPCVHGTCSQYLNTYRCTCRADAYGRNCEYRIIETTQTTTPALMTTSRTPTTTTPMVFPLDCRAISVTGIYTIEPLAGKPKNVTCRSGGWTVIQQRFDGSVDFYRTWQEYKDGFGSASSEYWIGNDAIHALTQSGRCELRIDISSLSGDKTYANYSTFFIDDEAHMYMLHVSGYTGIAGDSLISSHGGFPFSTKDRDNDSYSTGSCAQDKHAGYWYSLCNSSNLNGNYQVKMCCDGFYWTSSMMLSESTMLIKY